MFDFGGLDVCCWRKPNMFTPPRQLKTKRLYSLGFLDLCLPVKPQDLITKELPATPYVRSCRKFRYGMRWWLLLFG